MSVGLVLEGGGLRGVYTAGVLDEFLKEKIVFPDVYAVSAGACCSLSYVSGQFERNKEIFYKYVPDDRYISIRNLRQTGSLFGFDFIFGELFHTLMPFDYDAFRQSPVRLHIGTTELQSGSAVFFGNADLDDTFLPVQASSSLPFLSNIVTMGGKPYLDGGLAAPIPYHRSLQDGNSKNVVVLTRDYSYRKAPGSAYPHAAIHVHYRDYPAFGNVLEHRSFLYNHQISEINQQECAGNMVVIRPSAPINIGRYEKNANTLLRIYDLARRDAHQKLPAVRAILAENS